VIRMITANAVWAGAAGCGTKLPSTTVLIVIGGRPRNFRNHAPLSSNCGCRYADAACSAERATSKIAAPAVSLLG